LDFRAQTFALPVLQDERSREGMSWSSKPPTPPGAAGVWPGQGRGPLRHPPPQRWCPPPPHAGAWRGVFCLGL